MKKVNSIISSCLVFLLFLLFSFNKSSVDDEYLGIPNYCECTTFDTVYFQGNIPYDSGQIPNQAVANCFAWKEFVALNWPSDGSNNFGNPSNNSLSTWETYMTKEILLPANGNAPPPWGTKHEFLNSENTHKRVLFHSSKFTNFTDTITVSEIGQAAPKKKPNWLGAHNDTNLWYEVLVNEDEYNYITDPRHQFYNADKQLSWVQAGNVIQLPKGSISNKTVGAIELKAAWMEVLPNTSIDKSRYKISEAILVDPGTGKQRNTEVALIGLHIIHKTESQPTWIWATFEHVDNAPNAQETASGFYNLYNVSCVDKTMSIPAAYSISKKDTTVTISCKSDNESPPYYLREGGPSPTQIQVTRTTPLDNSSVAINTTMKNAIKQYYPNSVFQYYELVDVIWSSNPTLDSNQPTKVPLKLTSMNPNNNVANSSMETYAQATKCTSCHQFGSIAGKGKYATDFSFVLSSASSAAKQ